MEGNLVHLVTTYPHLAYILIILIAIVEGPVLSMVVGALVKIGVFHIVPVYIVLMAGDIIGDTILYWLGYRYGMGIVKRLGKYLKVTEDSIGHVQRIFHLHNNKILVISKLTNGFGLSMAVLLTAGIVRIPFWKFSIPNLIGQFIWTGMLLAIGYYFSHAYMQISSIVGKIGLVIGLLLLLFGFIKMVRFARRKAEQAGTQPTTTL